MKTLPLLVSTVLLVLCHSATVTVGGPTGKSKLKGHDLTKPFDVLNLPFEAAEACFEEVEEYFQTQGSISSTSSNQVLGRKRKRIENDSQFKGHDLTKPFDVLNRPFKAAEACFEEVEEYFQTQGSITSTSSKGRKCERLESDNYYVEFRDLKTSETHSFISIPDLEGNDHVYVVQVTPKLGRGASGSVYLAKDIKIPDEFVAIKGTLYKDELEGLKLVGELLGSAEKARGALFLVMPFAPGITLKELASKMYNGRPVYRYWMYENNKGYRTLLNRIARFVVAPMLNRYFMHTDLKGGNMMVAQIDENYVPTETDPTTGLQHLRAVDFGGYEEILEAENILDYLRDLPMVMFNCLPFPPGITEKTIQTFQRDVVDALNDNKFDIRRTEDGMPIYVARSKESLPSS